jgi:prepilin-type N-terminal cleavage/methylation domain-containing protein
MIKNISMRKGFTLIELLVVIAIIGILSAIVIVNLNSARNKSQDTAIKAQSAQLKNTAAVYYDDNNYGYSASAVASIIAGACPTANSGSFAGTFFTSSEALKALAGVKKNSGYDAYCSIGSSAIGAQSWALTARLRNPSAAGAVVYWCVDSAGTAKEVAAHYQPSNTNKVTCP